LSKSDEVQTEEVEGDIETPTSYESSCKEEQYGMLG